MLAINIIIVIMFLLCSQLTGAVTLINTLSSNESSDFCFLLYLVNYKNKSR